MADFDVFNGDADGLCALLQLRLAEPRDSALITGVKRDIQLLAQIEAGHGDRVTALDISLDKNRPALLALLEAGVSVFYCDHHFAGEIPAADHLDALINTAPDVCTSLLVNGRLKGQFVQWALVGTFGDNLRQSALKLAASSNCAADLDRYERLGICINYNAYGAELADLHFAPAQLFRNLLPYATPDQFLAAEPQMFEQLETGYFEDLGRARKARILHQSGQVSVVVLPSAPWARRVSGVFGNQLANDNPHCAHAVLTEKPVGGFLVSVRAPLTNRTGADEVCRQFESGGGRKAAAGINHLPADELNQFIKALSERYSD